jgi:hypothetical protein
MVITEDRASFSNRYSQFAICRAVQRHSTREVLSFRDKLISAQDKQVDHDDASGRTLSTAVLSFLTVNILSFTAIPGLFESV